MAAERAITVDGAGRFSCGHWLEIRATRNQPDDFRFVQAREWISGFVTAYNMYMHSAGDVADGNYDRDGWYAWIDKYCRENPLKPIFKATERLIEELEQR